MSPPCALPTIVTGIHDIGRARLAGEFYRPFARYVRHLERLAKTRCPMVVYAGADLQPRILKARASAPTALEPLSDERLRACPDFDAIQAIRQSPRWRNQAAWLSRSPQAELELYNPLVMSKMRWLAAQAEANPFHTDAFFWVDGGLLQHLGPIAMAEFERGLLRAAAPRDDRFFLLGFPYEMGTEIHGFDRGAMAAYCRTDYVDRVCRAGVIGGSAQAIRGFAQLYEELLHTTLSQGHMGTEENILTIASYQAPARCRIEMLPTGSLVPYFHSPPARLTARDLVRHAARPGRSVKTIATRLRQQWALRTLRRGHDSLTQQILKSPPVAAPPHDDFDLHMLVCAADLLNALWSLKTFHCFGEIAPRLFLHDDGTLTPVQARLLLAHFPHARFVTRDDADRAQRSRLRHHPAATRYRLTEYSWPAIKLLDFAYYSADRAFMIMDADVLCFRRPDDLLANFARRRGFFMPDLQDAYTWPTRRWPALLGVPGLSRVNVGLLGIPAGAYDLDFVERGLGRYYELAPTPRPYWLEQTIWAAMIARQGDNYARLPETYSISTNRRIGPTTVCHHFTKDRTISRPNFTLAGLRYLARSGRWARLGIPS